MRDVLITLFFVTLVLFVIDALVAAKVIKNGRPSMV